MSGDPVQDLSAHEVHDEHRQLRHVLQQITRILGGRRAGRVDVVRHLEDFEVRLVAHFEHEEHGGYFKEALAEAPRLQSRADALLKEHDEFRRSLAQLRCSAHARTAGDAWWEAIEDCFLDLASRLRKHEQGETELLQEAYTLDLGAED